jgi:hypothetical protein
MQHHVYDTSHALTTGIKIRKLRHAVDPDAVKTRAYYEDGPSWRSPINRIHPSRWHTTKAEAIADAEALRNKKIASLEKKLAKLRAMTFDAPDLPEEN